MSLKQFAHVWRLAAMVTKHIQYRTRRCRDYAIRALPELCLAIGPARLAAAARLLNWSPLSPGKSAAFFHSSSIGGHRTRRQAVLFFGRSRGGHEAMPNGGILAAMRASVAILIGAAIIAATIAVMGSWELTTAPTAGVFRLDRWTGNANRCALPPSGNKMVCD